jgi:hypothetical protein
MRNSPSCFQISNSFRRSISNPAKYGSKIVLGGTVFVLTLVIFISFAFGQGNLVPVKVAPGTLHFGKIVVGETSAVSTVTLISKENVPLNFTSILPSGDFAITSNTCGSSIPAKGACTVGLTFSPTDIGSRTGTLLFKDDAANSPQEVDLTGNGSSSVSFSPPSLALSFASTPVGDSAVTKTVTLTNNLNTTLTVSPPTALGDFAIASNTCAAGVGAGLTCTIGVSFTPTAVGARTGTLIVPFTAFGGPAMISLSGTGNAAHLLFIGVTPANPSIVLGLNQQFTATGTFKDGETANLTTSVTWASSASGVATISNTSGSQGLATSVGQGATNVTATLGAIIGSTNFTVSAPVLVSIAVTPANPSILLGGMQQFTATGTYNNGSMQNLTSTATWSSSIPTVASISNASGSQGLATPVTVGTTIIQASSGAINGSTNLTVTAGFVFTGSMSTVRGAPTATLLNNGLVLIAGGGDSTGAIASAELYNPSTAMFTLTGSLNTARGGHTATLLLNGMVLLAGGNGSSGTLASAELYNPATGTFTPTGSMNISRVDDSAALLSNGMVLIAGGDAGVNAFASAELYDPTTGTFTPTGSLTTARTRHTATLLNNGMVLIAGDDSAFNALASAELYNPATGTFIATGSMNAGRFNHTATLLNDGMVLLAGGCASGCSVLASAELYDPATGTFTVTGSMNTARYFHTARLLNNGMVLMAGGVGSSAYLASAELYDPATGAFTQTGGLNTARYVDAAALLNDGMVLIAGGIDSSGNALASAELYEPGTFTPLNLVSIAVTPSSSTLSPGTTQQFIATGTFSDSSAQQLASVAWSSSDTTLAQVSSDAGNHGQSIAVAAGAVTISATAGSISGSATLTVRPTGFVLTGSMSTAHYAPTETLLNNGLVLIAGGYNGSALAISELYNPATGTFTSTGSLNTARYGHTATLLNNGMVLIAGGVNSSYLASAELYNPTTGTFTPTGSLITARVDDTATLLNNGTVLIAGGDAGVNAFASAELYDPTTGTFTLTGSLTTGRTRHTATLLNNGMVLIAGDDFAFNALASAELYNPATGTFIATGSMNTGRFGHTATLLNNGLVLMAGGCASGCNSLASAELYDSATGAFTVTGSLNTARYAYTATLLNNGMVLMAGGYNAGALASAELYNPATGTFTPTGSMNTARTVHAATLLPNGMVLIVGGYNGSVFFASAELY